MSMKFGIIIAISQGQLALPFEVGRIKIPHE